MSTKTRVILADDSAVVRRLLAESLNSDPDLEVLAAGKHGQEAVNLHRTQPADVVLLDVEMPVMDGIEAVRAIRSFDKRVPIVMFSSLTVKGGEATLDALAAGASDYVAKPASAGHMQEALQYIRNELIPKLKQFRRNSALTASPLRISSPPSTTGPADIVAIGSSTGGPSALEVVLSSWGGKLTVPVLIVQHMPPVFTQLLADRLSQRSGLKVREAQDGQVVAAGEVWVAPGNFHMRVDRRGTQQVLRLDQSEPENSCRPAVDVLFRSVAAIYGGRSLAVVLTGMGKDGMLGSREIRAKGGRVFAQDEGTSTVWGMPRAVAEAGLANKVLPLEHIGPEVAASLFGIRGVRSAVAS